MNFIYSFVLLCRLVRELVLQMANSSRVAVDRVRCPSIYDIDELDLVVLDLDDHSYVLTLRQLRMELLIVLRHRLPGRTRRIILRKTLTRYQHVLLSICREILLQQQFIKRYYSHNVFVLVQLYTAAVITTLWCDLLFINISGFNVNSLLNINRNTKLYWNLVFS